MAIELVDIGVNLTSPSFDHDREQVIQRALSCGVSQMVITGTNIRSSQAALELAQRHPGILYSTVGVHPHDARYCNDKTISTLEMLSKNKEAVAIGECGLDYNRNFSPRPVQDRWLEYQIELACRLKMPLFLHEREAHTRLIEILGKYRQELPPTVVHCFTGTAEELENYLAMGFYIGITGWICDERRGKHLCDLVHRIPLNRLMLETDAPFLTPRNMRPKPKRGRNEPAFLRFVLKMVADCSGKSEQEIADATTLTAKSFFGLEPKK